ncbi:MAG TPA: Uma2 family endonuclease [Thermoanaerobaculia bacterium]|nr:Uma2 family endonuclease [Thermoanaerobaculia bacterium]
MALLAPLPDDTLRIPARAHTLAGFREWAHSEDFPEHERIDFLGGEVEVEMSPEDLQSHGALKAEIAAVLHELVARRRLGHVFIDRARVSAPEVELSAEPDVVVVLRESLEAGRVRYLPSPGKGPGRFAEIEGAPDLVVEVVSDASVRKDTERLPRLYAAAGIPELWLADARGAEPRLRIHRLARASYELVRPDGEGWSLSARLEVQVRLRREVDGSGLWFFQLETRPQR